MDKNEDEKKRLRSPDDAEERAKLQRIAVEFH